MFSLSTSWNSHRHDNGISLIKEIKALGFDTVELNFALTGKAVEDILILKEASQIKVSSLHNVCPPPQTLLTDNTPPP